jgi:hypothetical protein
MQPAGEPHLPWEEITMQKLMVTLLVGIIALAPAIAAAQSSSGSGSTGSSSSGSTPSGTSGSSGSGSTSVGSGSSTGSPSASPKAGDMSKYTTKTDCEKAGGKWQASSKMCMKK